MSSRKPIITTQCYQDQDLVFGAAAIIAHKLHCDNDKGNWILRSWCESLLISDQYVNQFCAIAIISRNGEPVATAIRTASKLLMAYTKPTYRRKGHSSLAVRSLPYCKGQWAGSGAPGSYEFWSTLKYDCESVESLRHAFLL